MRETSTMDDLNCKMQVHARVCEENKLELEWELEEKNDTYWNNFVATGVSLKDRMGRVRGQITIIFSRMIQHNIKVLVQYYVKY